MNRVVNEGLWYVGISVVVALAQVAVEFDPEQIVEWDTWALGAVAAIIRATGAAILGYVAKRRLAGGS